MEVFVFSVDLEEDLEEEEEEFLEEDEELFLDEDEPLVIDLALSSAFLALDIALSDLLDLDFELFFFFFFFAMMLCNYKLQLARGYE